MTDHILLQSLIDGDSFTGFYVLSHCALKEFDGGARLDIELRDASGAVPGVVWDDARELVETLQKGMAVKVQGRLGSYRDRPQITVERIRPAADDEYDPDQFLPRTTEDIGRLRERIHTFVESITDPYLKQLGEQIFGNTQSMEQYLRAPGGKKWHHSYLGGLAEHSVGVTAICDAVAGLHPDLNRDLLIIAGLLHDIGKIKEFTVTTLIDYSDEGRLVGHIVMGEHVVRNMCDRIEGFPSQLKMLLSHLMLSHQGFHAYSTPVEPMIPEGFVLYYADEIDSKLNALDRIAHKHEGERWSGFVNLLNRYIYLDRDGTEDENG